MNADSQILNLAKEVNNDTKVVSNFDSLTSLGSIEKIAGIGMSLDDQTKEKMIPELVRSLKDIAAAGFSE